ncbi:hypothetical protein ScPMuIL_013325 [Solemya velum]
MVKFSMLLVRLGYKNIDTTLLTSHKKNIPGIRTPVFRPFENRTMARRVIWFLLLFIAVGIHGNDYCLPNPCINGAQCEECYSCSDGYKCNCAEGFIGEDCAQVDPCAVSPCLNEATCEVCFTCSDSYRCTCAEGFTGDTCSEIDECSCRSDEYKCPTGPCLCLEDWEVCDGLSECPDDSDEFGCECVESEPCQNGGTCTGCNDCERSYTCECADTFYGYDCEHVNECETENGGCEQMCTDHEEGYECSCFGEWKLGTDQHSCDRDGGWSEWAEDGNCTVTCGGGTITYNRECNNPEPIGDGADCEGNDTKTEDCNTEPCPIDGDWTSWLSWDCSTTCGPGIITSSRTCTNPTPSNGGANCNGPANKTENCNVEDCPACENNDCPEHTTCVPQDGGGYVCLCDEGFAGDCDICTDIDECATGTDDCPPETMCLNTEGSYLCPCDEGFTEDAPGVCRDVNECTNGEADCGGNAVCINKLGTYACVCCDGYEDNGDGECVGSSSSHTTGEKCCFCYGKSCKREGKVCGDDGVDYTSVADLKIAECKEETDIGVDYYGECQGDCDGVECLKYQTCEMYRGKPRCVCEECSNGEQTSGPVCSETFDLYDDECDFKERMCKYDLELSLLPNGTECNPENKPVGEWSPWSSCSVSCGKGTRTRTRVAMRPMSEEESLQNELEATASCYMNPCSDGPCVGFDCENPSAKCVDVGGEAECECPSCEGVGTDRVCGIVGTKISTFKNLCRLQKKACEKETTYELIHEGICTAEPANCQRVPLIGLVTNDNWCTTESEVVRHDCGGSCGDQADDCCQAQTHENRTFSVKCLDGTTEDYVIEDVVSCNCMPLMP